MMVMSNKKKGEGFFHVSFLEQSGAEGHAEEKAGAAVVVVAFARFELVITSAKPTISRHDLLFDVSQVFGIVHWAGGRPFRTVLRFYTPSRALVTPKRVGTKTK